MAVVIAIIAGTNFAIGGLFSYATKNFFEDTPSKEHVNTMVQNHIDAHIQADNAHETFQNNVITIAFAIVMLIGVVIILNVIYKAMRSNRRNTRHNDVEMQPAAAARRQPIINDP